MNEARRVSLLSIWLLDEAILPEEWEDDMDLLLEMAQEHIGEDDLTERELREAIKVTEKQRREEIG